MQSLEASPNSFSHDKKCVSFYKHRQEHSGPRGLSAINVKSLKISEQGHQVNSSNIQTVIVKLALFVAKIIV